MPRLPRNASESKIRGWLPILHSSRYLSRCSSSPPSVAHALGLSWLGLVETLCFWNTSFDCTDHFY